jgi:hypothetical protein
MLFQILEFLSSFSTAKCQYYIICFRKGILFSFLYSLKISDIKLIQSAIHYVIKFLLFQ